MNAETDQPGAKGRLYKILALRLIADIREGRYDVGARLPAERELAIEHGVSRPTVREAIIALEVQGLVEVRVGSGVYVRRPIQPADDAGTDIGAFELTEARLLFEGEAAALAASNMSDEELDRLDALVAAIAAANATGSGEAPDQEFHLAIAGGSGNGAVVKIIESLWALRRTSPECVLMFDRARDQGSKPVVEEHAAIVTALRSRSPAAARAAMRAHLGRVIDHLLDATEAEALAQARQAVANTRNRFARAREV